MTDNENILCVLSWDWSVSSFLVLIKRNASSGEEIRPRLDYFTDTNELLDSYPPNQVSGVTRGETKRQKP